MNRGTGEGSTGEGREGGRTDAGEPGTELARSRHSASAEEAEVRRAEASPDHSRDPPALQTTGRTQPNTDGNDCKIVIFKGCYSYKLKLVTKFGFFSLY